MSGLRVLSALAIASLLGGAARQGWADGTQLYGQVMTAVTEPAAHDRVRRLLRDVSREEAGGEARLRLGQALLELELPAWALAPLRDALDLKPGRPEIAALLAAALLGAGQGDQALVLANRIVSDQPADPARWRFLAEMRLQSGDHAGALQAAGRVLLLVPGDADAIFVCADIFARQGKGALARKLFGEIVPRVSDRPALEFAWGRLALREDSWQEAVDHFTAGINLRREAGALHDRGVAWARLARDELAERDFRAALALDPGAAATRLNLANLLIDRGEGQAAARLAPRLSEVDAAAYWLAAGRYYALTVSSAASRRAALASFEHAQSLVDAERYHALERARAIIVTLPPPKDLGKPVQPFAPEEPMH